MSSSGVEHVRASWGYARNLKVMTVNARNRISCEEDEPSHERLSLNFQCNDLQSHILPVER